MKKIHIAVVGLGIMGSAITYELSRRRKGVVAFERFWSSHDQGSSYGHTRLFRRSHFEHEDYVPLATAALEGWKRLEQESGRSLFVETGALVVGPGSSQMITGSRASGSQHGIAQEELGVIELRRRFPWLDVSRSDVGLLEPSAGVLLAQDSVASFQRGAVREGAELRFGANCEIADPEARDGVELLVNGERILAEHVIVAAGPWCSRLLPDAQMPKLVVERVTSYWFEPRAVRDSFDPERFPVVLWDHPQRPFITFPAIAGPGVKVGFHHNRQAVDPDELIRIVSQEEIDGARRQLESLMPVVAGRMKHASTCMYTNTRDGHFAVGFVDPAERIMLASACSGHGFKFAPVVGEVVADLVETGESRHSMDLFRLDRRGLYARSGIFATDTAADEAVTKKRASSGRED